MQLRTPRRYTRRGQRRRVVSFKWLWLWITAPILIFIGIGIYQNRTMFIPEVQRIVNGVVDSASNTFATATAPTPTPTQDPADFIERAETFWRQGSIEQALSLYESALPALPNDVTAHYRVTMGLVIEGRFDEALAAAERTVTANPFSSDAWAIRAWTLENSGRYGEAIASALQALELDPDNARAMAFLAEAYLDVGQNERALETVNRALELDPDSFEAYRIRGRIVQNTQFDFEAARADYLKAYELAPNMVYPVLDLAWMDYSLGDYQTAIDLVRENVDLNPQNSQLLYNLGVLYFRGPGDFNSAADSLLRCVEIDAQQVDCHYMLGRAQIGLQEYDDAARSLETAIDLGSTNPIHFFWAGRAQISLGNCASAINYLRPGYELARQLDDPGNLLTDFEEIGRECQLSLGGASLQPEVTETPAP
jgi:tetratricopeptide (TPR) repeat protein